jgi:L-aspartate oxidase
VTVFEEHFLVDLLTAGERCIGALILDPAARALVVFWASAVVLATGGTGQLFRVTTNPEIATGDGVAAAWRAGAEISDLEFVQFHPTALDHAANPKALVTEALRGEGAYLLDCDEERFMLGVHPLAELAPRDVVTREIQQVMARCRRPNVWLDARHLGEERLRARFPNIWRRCAEAGYDLAADLIPVAPAAHYMVGGVRVDLEARSTLEGLYATGEVSASGLHGANRLASNSLLEGVVLSRRAVRSLAGESRAPRVARVMAQPADGSTSVVALHGALETVRSVMSEFVSANRSGGGLEQAADVPGSMSGILEVEVRRRQELELQDLYTMAVLLAWAARYRKESRGVHFREDYPERDDVDWAKHVVWRRGALPVEVPVGEFSGGA